MFPMYTFGKHSTRIPNMEAAVKKILAGLVLIVALLVGTPAQAVSMQAKDPAGNTVTITAGACESDAAAAQLPKLNEVLARIPGFPQLTRGDLRGGSMTYQGKQYAICWTGVNGMVAVMDDAGEDNSLFPVPMRDFAPAPEI
jgi:hypothetical protein